jgi:hypothetical protein
MSEAQATALRPSTLPSLKANQMYIVGRLQHVSKFDGNFDNIVVMPAPDAYSKPSFCRVTSKDRLGSAGDDVKVLCAFNGWPNTYTNKDGEKVQDAKGFFVAIE